jgi:hypothetical protein
MIMRWQVKQRMEFITTHLAEHGWIGRVPLIVKFDISVPQASNDLTMYQAIHPNAIQYDAHLKRYVRQKQAEAAQ